MFVFEAGRAGGLSRGDEHEFTSKVSPINLDMDNGVTYTMLSICNHSRSPSLSVLRTW